MNIQKRLRMDLEQALLTYGNDIDYIILRDGTSIEIIDDNDDDFVEEKMEEHYNNYDNYMFKEINQEGTLRGKKSLGRPLRKTVLKSNFNGQNKKLRNNVNDNDNNVVVKISENNEYLQCANCFKFFNSKETEEETDNTSRNTNNSNINNNINQINNNYINQNKNNQNIPRQVIPPQQGYNPNNQNYNNNININNRTNQQRYNQNNNQAYYQKNPNQYPQNQIPRGPQQRINMPPPPQQPYYYTNNQIPKGNMRIPYNNNYNQNNQIFRARKRNSGRYQQKEINNEFIQNNNMINKYPGSAKKQKNPEINYDFEVQEKGYIGNNLGNYFNENETKYYEYPANKNNNKNYFAHSSSKKQENNYYQQEIQEFQENDYYRY